MSLSLAEWSTEELRRELNMTERVLNGYAEDYTEAQLEQLPSYLRTLHYNRRLRRELTRREADTRPQVTE